MHHVILARVIKNFFTFHTILNSFDKIRVYWSILNITCHQVLGASIVYMLHKNFDCQKCIILVNF